MVPKVRAYCVVTNPPNSDGVVLVTGTEVFTPDGVRLSNVEGCTVEMDLQKGYMVAVLRVPVCLKERQP